MKKVLFLCLCVIILVSGCSVKKMDEITESEEFAREFSVPSDNPFVYASLNDVFDMLNNGSGILFFGNSDCEICNIGAQTLTDVLIKNKVDVAYYYNPKKIMETNGSNYKRLLKMIKEDLNDDFDFSLPSVFVVKNGTIVGYNDDLAELVENNEDLVLDNDTKKELKNEYNKLIETIKE